MAHDHWSVRLLRTLHRWIAERRMALEQYRAANEADYQFMLLMHDMMAMPHVLPLPADDGEVAHQAREMAHAE